MAIIANYKDKILQAAATRFVSPAPFVFTTPSQVIGLAVTQETLLNQSGETYIESTVTWTPTIDSFSNYTLAYKNITNNALAPFKYIDLTEASVKVPETLANQDLVVKVRANYGDKNGAWSVDLAFNSGQDTIGPAATSFTAKGGVDYVELTITKPVERDYDYTEIWYSATNDRSTATNIAQTSDTVKTFRDLPKFSGFAWIRHVDTTGNIGSYYPTSATGGLAVGTTGVSVAILDNETAIPYQSGAPTGGDGAGGDSSDGSYALIPVDIAITGVGNNLRDITLTWEQYTQGSVPAEQLALYYYEVGTDSAVGSVSGVPIDKNTHGNVVMLLNFDTATGNLKEEAQGGHLTLSSPAVSIFDSTPTIAAGKFGEAMHFTNSSGSRQHATIPFNASKWSMPVGSNYCLDYWIKPDSLPASGFTSYYMKIGGSDLSFDDTGILHFTIEGTAYVISTPVTVGQWNHIVIQRLGDIILFGLNGNISRLDYSLQTFNAFNVAQVSTFGALSDSVGWQFGLNGSLDGIRLISGKGIVEIDIPAPTEQLQTIAGSAVHIPLNTDASDLTSNGTSSTIGNVTINASNGGFNGSALLNQSGSTSYINYVPTAPISIALNEAFTIDIRFKIESIPTSEEFLLSFGNIYSYVSIGTNGKLTLSFAGQSFAKSVDFADVTTGEFNHIRILRKSGSGNYLIYYNGKLVKISNYSSAINMSSIQLGCRSNLTQGFNGYIDDFRLVVGTAVSLPSTYPVPTTAPTLTLNPPPEASLLLHFDGYNGGTTFTDSSKNNLSVTGTAITSTDAKVFGAASAFFAAKSGGEIGDTIIFPPEIATISGDFWFEFRVRFSSANTGNGSPQVFANLGNNLSFELNGGNISNPRDIFVRNTHIGTIPLHTFSGGSLDWLDTWFTIKASFVDGNIYIFFDGILKFTEAYGYTIDSSAMLGNTGSNYFAFNGYIDEFVLYTGIGGDITDYIVQTEPYKSTIPNPITFRPVTIEDSVKFLPIDSKKYTFTGVPIDRNYRVGIAAIRNSASGVQYTTPVIQPTTAPDWRIRANELTSGIPVYTADTILNNVDQLVLDSNNANNLNYTAIVNPTLNNNATDITHILSSDGLTVTMSFNWNYSVSDEANIDGFFIVVYQSATDSNAYVFGTFMALEATSQLLPNVRTFKKSGLPVSDYYSIAIVAYRNVNKEPTLAPTGILFSNYIQSTFAANTPYRPASNVSLAPDVNIGTVDATGGQTVTSTLTTKPGTSAATNTWIAINSNGKKYWVQAWEDAI